MKAPPNPPKYGIIVMTANYSEKISNENKKHSQHPKFGTTLNSTQTSNV